MVRKVRPGTLYSIELAIKNVGVIGRLGRSPPSLWGGGLLPGLWVAFGLLAGRVYWPGGST